MLLSNPRIRWVTLKGVNTYATTYFQFYIVDEFILLCRDLSFMSMKDRSLQSNNKQDSVFKKGKRKISKEGEYLFIGTVCFFKKKKNSVYVNCSLCQQNMFSQFSDRF